MVLHRQRTMPSTSLALPPDASATSGSAFLSDCAWVRDGFLSIWCYGISLSSDDRTSMMLSTEQQSPLHQVLLNHVQDQSWQFLRFDLTMGCSKNHPILLSKPVPGGNSRHASKANYKAHRQRLRCCRRGRYHLEGNIAL